MMDTDVNLLDGTRAITNADVKEMTRWLIQNNVKYSYAISPIWGNIPSYVKMNAIDALAFKIRFNLI